MHQYELTDPVVVKKDTNKSAALGAFQKKKMGRNRVSFLVFKPQIGIKLC